MGTEEQSPRRRKKKTRMVLLPTRTIETVVVSILCCCLFNMFTMMMHWATANNSLRQPCEGVEALPRFAGHAIVPPAGSSSGKTTNSLDVRRNAKKQLARHQGTYEMPEAEPPSVYMMIPSVPRENDEDYLLKVLVSVSDFPNDRIFVFHNGNQTHLRWEQARALHPKMHYIRNEALPPPGHPSIFDTSLPLPDEIQEYIELHNDTEVAQARNDTESRKQWRRKECYDFVRMGRYLLDEIGDPAKSNTSWFIFNQDDAEWKVPVMEVQSRLAVVDTPRVDLFQGGMVSIAFRGFFLTELLEFADLWCDFKPVDWMTWSFTRDHGYKEKRFTKLVSHIGGISSRLGRVEGEKERMLEAKAKQIARQKELAAKQKAREQAKLMEREKSKQKTEQLGIK